LDGVATETVPFFGLEVPTDVPGVPAEVLNPRGTWASPEAYDARARVLANAICQNFEQFVDRVPEAVRNAGPSSAE
ncbi:MAG TPA: hypothetical protein VEY93_06235, partial [Longimicrobium sp.]|nr:hypothetical protein [Longimicrobium sp.]